LPIIALTAGVTTEEREKCLGAGMNDLIPKPINPDRLLGTLVRWLNLEHGTSHSAQVEQDKPTESTNDDFKLDNLLAMLGNDHSLMRRLLLNFVEDFASLPSEVDAAIQTEAMGSCQGIGT